MRLLLSVPGVLAALLMLGVSGSMNYLFMSSLGQSEIEGYVLGSASAGADIIKALLPFWIAWAWQAKRGMFVTIGTIVFVFFTAFSLTSAIGFSASNRTNLAGSQEGLNAQLIAVRSDLSGLDQKRSNLPAHRASAVIEQDIERTKQHRRWTTTKGCADGEVTAAKSRVYCSTFFALRKELAQAIESNRLEAKITELKREERRLQRAGAGKDADPQVSLLAGLFSLDRGIVRNTLIVVVALLVEVGSGLGLFLATGHSEILRGRSSKEGTIQTEIVAISRPEPSSVSFDGEYNAGQAGNGNIIDTARPSVSMIEADAITDREAAMAHIEDYCLERLQPAEEGGVTMVQIFEDYQSWCTSKQLDSAPHDDFATTFEGILEYLEVEQDEGVYQGVSIGS